MMVAGIGCRRGATPANVLAAIAAARTHFKVSGRELVALAVVARKIEEPGIVIAAKALSLKILAIAEAEVEKVAPGLLSNSEASLAATGAASASEAAALAGAGEGARLLGPRLVIGDVTCAIAVNGYEP